MNLHTKLPPIPFIDVASQRRRLGPAIDAAVARVLDHCQYILGPEVKAFETQLAAFCGAKHVVTCASGTDALVLVLRAMEIGPGDAVLCPSFTFCATAEVRFWSAQHQSLSMSTPRRSTSMQKVL